MPPPPSTSTHQGTRAADSISPPVCTTLITAASGPTALATSLEPWAKAMAQAVKIISTPNTRSTPEKPNWSVWRLLAWTRRSITVPSAATATPARMESSRLAPKLRSRPTCLSPLVRVTMVTAKPTRKTYMGT